MRNRAGLLLSAWLLSLAGLLGCSDDRIDTTRPGVDAGPNPAGSCNFAAAALCREYAGAQATPAAASNCAAEQGEWSGGKCPFDDRYAVCLQADVATRTYVYSEAAMAQLAMMCPVDLFVEFEVEDDDEGTSGSPAPDPDAGGAGGAGDAGPSDDGDGGADEDAGD